MNRQQALDVLLRYPYKFGHLVGFTKLTKLHNEWLQDMICGTSDETLQAHRLSYKTTCISIALAILAVVRPNKRILFMRKTDTDVKEITEQVAKILKSPTMNCFCQVIHGFDLKLIKENSNELTTNITNDPRGSAQITAQGITGSLTGKHYDIIFTDDIVNIKDRISKAERDHTKLIYQELRNIVNRDGKIFNTGTPWHKEDAFALMPNPKKYDCYSTGLISDAELQVIKSGMIASLFAANYELRHVAAEDVIFTNPQTGAEPSKAEQGICHIDASYGGEDYTAFTICKKHEDKYYILGRLWHKHIDDCEDEIIALRKAFNAGRIYCEDNGDKGYLAKELRNKGETVTTYHESMNKFLKITSYLKNEWENVMFVAGTDKDYIEQICDYNENAEHDDAPDSCASIVRKLWKKKDNQYQPIWM